MLPNVRPLSIASMCVFALAMISCGQQEATLRSSEVGTVQSERSDADSAKAEIIDQYVVNVFEDSKGVLWLATLSKGLARYDGHSLKYLTVEDGLSDNSVGAILEDEEGMLWISTHNGLSMYDGNTFKTWNTDDGLPHFRLTNLLIDSRGTFWIGTWAGVATFDGSTFTEFELPFPNVDLEPYQTTMLWTTEIAEDRNGKIWFGRDGYGACLYDPVAAASGEPAFLHYTEGSGLPSNNVQGIHADGRGHVWFANRITERDHPQAHMRSGPGGLSRLDKNGVTHFTDVPGLSENDVYSLHEDSKGNVWISAPRFGLYRYDGSSFKLFDQTDPPGLMKQYTIQSMLEDSKGQFWFGCSGGVMRLIDDTLVPVYQNGPWD